MLRERGYVWEIIGPGVIPGLAISKTIDAMSGHDCTAMHDSNNHINKIEDD